MVGSRSDLRRIRAAVRTRAYDITAHAAEEMAEDDLDIDDAEAAMLNGSIIRAQTDDPRGTRFTLHGTAADAETSVGVVCRFTETGRLLVITVYAVTE